MALYSYYPVNKLRTEERLAAMGPKCPDGAEQEHNASNL
jgi:hypothetical protein